MHSSLRSQSSCKGSQGDEYQKYSALLTYGSTYELSRYCFCHKIVSQLFYSPAKLFQRSCTMIMLPFCIVLFIVLFYSARRDAPFFQRYLKRNVIIILSHTVLLKDPLYISPLAGFIATWHDLELVGVSLLTVAPAHMWLCRRLAEGSTAA